MTENALECGCGSTDFELVERGRVGPKDHLAAVCADCDTLHAALTAEDLSDTLEGQLRG